MPQIFLSNIPRWFRIETTSPPGQFQARRVDFTLGTLNVDYPQIKQLLFQFNNPDELNNTPAAPPEAGKNILSVLAWDRIQEIDWKKGVVRIGEPSDLQEIDREVVSQALFLERDILDAFIIDLESRRVRRANDLVLDDTGGLCLRGADVSLRALLRRISWGRYRRVDTKELQDWKYVEFLRGDPAAVWSGVDYHRRIIHLPPGEIANLSERLPYLHAAELILLLPEELAADTLELMTAERQIQVFEELDEPYALKVLARMAPDIAADLIGRLDTDSAHKYLEMLPPSSSHRIVDLLHYPEASVGGIMTNDVIALPADMKVPEVRERLRDLGQRPDFIYFVYVVDSDEGQHLLGVVTLRGILVARDDQRLDEIMNPYLEVLSPLDSPLESAYRLINSQLAALPVVSTDGRLLGAVTVDAAISLVAPSSWRSQLPRVFS
jgi:CBS domain-containing protein